MLVWFASSCEIVCIEVCSINYIFVLCSGKRSIHIDHHSFHDTKGIHFPVLPRDRLK